jgi:hypothetical protein
MEVYKLNKLTLAAGNTPEWFRSLPSVVGVLDWLFWGETRKWHILELRRFMVLTGATGEKKVGAA